MGFRIHLAIDEPNMRGQNITSHWIDAATLALESEESFKESLYKWTSIAREMHQTELRLREASNRPFDECLCIYMRAFGAYCLQLACVHVQVRFTRRWTTALYHCGWLLTYHAMIHFLKHCGMHWPLAKNQRSAGRLFRSAATLNNYKHNTSKEKTPTSLINGFGWIGHPSTRWLARTSLSVSCCLWHVPSDSNRLFFNSRSNCTEFGA